MSVSFSLPENPEERKAAEQVIKEALKKALDNTAIPPIVRKRMSEIQEKAAKAAEEKELITTTGIEPGGRDPHAVKDPKGQPWTKRTEQDPRLKLENTLESIFAEQIAMENMTFKDQAIKKQVIDAIVQQVHGPALPDR